MQQEPVVSDRKPTSKVGFGLFSMLLLVGGLLLFCSEALAQESQTDVTVRKYLQGMGSPQGPDAGMSEMLRRIGERRNGMQPGSMEEPGADGETETQEGEPDEEEEDDGIGVEADEAEELSIYERMIRGIRIDPDRLLLTLRIFGREVFAKTKPSTFAPTNVVSVPTGYPIAAGDEIVVLLWGRINEEYRVKVDRDGKINIPRVGPISVAGLPFNVMQKNICDRVQSIEGVQASVTMGELRNIQVFLVGEVKAPGMYTVSALTNVTNALFAAGGPTRNGSLRKIALKRNGRTVALIDFYDFLLAGKNRTNVRLQSGDVVFVPVAKAMAAIAGNVRRSALYELGGETSLVDLIDLAGGTTPAAWVNRIQVERFEENKYQKVLDLTAESSKELPSFRIQDGDVVKIFPVIIKDQNTIYLSGNVLRPGKYEFKDGMRVSDLLQNYNELLPETYYEYAVVRRQDPPHYRESIVPFSLKNAMRDLSSADNLELRPQDEVVIYHRDFFEPDRTVAIDGAVNSPGVQRLLENMTIRDVIIRAGGLREDASPNRGELYRRKYDGEIVTTEKIEFCVQCALDDDAGHNVLLQKFDRVYIRRKRGWEDERRVVLKGEFVFPGEYVLLEHESLGDLVSRAGGFTKDAYLAAAVFTRESVKELESRRIKDYLQRLEMDMMKLTTEMASKEKSEEAKALLAQQEGLQSKLKQVQAVGRVVIDLTDEESYVEFGLENGDVLLVPKQMSTISVLGEVFNPATFTLEDRRRRSGHYVELAGGLKRHADKRNVYIVKANGSVRTRKVVNVSKYPLEPGDAVVVPQKIKYTNAFKVFLDTVMAVVQLTTLVALVATIIGATQ